jgi:hypothetical protein
MYFLHLSYFFLKCTDPSGYYTKITSLFFQWSRLEDTGVRSFELQVANRIVLRGPAKEAGAEIGRGEQGSDTPQPFAPLKNLQR